MIAAAGIRERELAEALGAVRARVERAAAAAHRDITEIELLPITKFFPATDVVILAHLGCTAVGESREQEASAKAVDVAAALSSAVLRPVRWHMVGRIQRNKARAIASWAYAVHSVDSLAVVAALDRGAVQALAEGRRAEALQVYVQISLDGDGGRGGVDVRAPDTVDELCASVQAAQGLNFVGLMGIPPLQCEPDGAFGCLQTELRRVQQTYPQVLGLSAGMSSDLEVAVKYGSTCVRVGTALMGPRPLTSP
jgi:pyridoxal phosphate enzyme (YggS family)